MSDIFQVANIGMIDVKQRLEAIGVNAASASLTGYRRHVVTATTFDASLAATDQTAAPRDPRSFMESIRTRVQHVDLQRGGAISTGRALDLAIDADDLFFALTDGTQTWLTRAGALRLNQDGVLVGENGLRVMGTQGDLRLPGDDVTVAADGRITHRGLLVGAIELFQPVDRASLQAAAGSLLIAPEGIRSADPMTVRIRSGMLEASNTDAAREMLGLMTLSRQFEGLSRVVQAYDELLGRTIQKLGEI